MSAIVKISTYSIELGPLYTDDHWWRNPCLWIFNKCRDISEIWGQHFSHSISNNDDN